MTTAEKARAFYLERVAKWLRKSEDKSRNEEWRSVARREERGWNLSRVVVAAGEAQGVQRRRSPVSEADGSSSSRPAAGQAGKANPSAGPSQQEQAGLSVMQVEGPAEVSDGG